LYYVIKYPPGTCFIIRSCYGVAFAISNIRIDTTFLTVSCHVISYNKRIYKSGAKKAIIQNYRTRWKQFVSHGKIFTGSKSTDTEALRWGRNL